MGPSQALRYVLIDRSIRQKGGKRMNEYTVLSQEAYEQAVAEGMSVENAVEWMMRTDVFRTLPERLLKFYDGTADELKACLRSGFFEAHTDKKEQESIRKSLNNWLSPVKGIDDRTISRSYALEMCFILKLPLEKADDWMRTVAGMRIHYREAQEFAAAYALKKGLSLKAYRELLEYLRAENCFELSQAPDEEAFTPTVAADVRDLDSPEDLRDYLTNNRAQFSAAHNTAYARFMSMMKVLLDEGTDTSVGELVEQNLYRRFLGKEPKLQSLAKSIRAGWPEESQISRMRSREAPVSRKVLILLFLASGGGLSMMPGDEDYWAEELEDEAGDADFETLYTQINALLVDCGFAPLDPRQPFDWMVLFGMATGDLFDLDSRFEAVLGSLFGNDSQRELTPPV